MKIEKQLINVYIEGNFTLEEKKEIKEKCKKLNLKQVKSVDKSNIFLGNIGINGSNNFEPSVKTVFNTAKAHSKEIPVLLYGYDTKLADERGKKLGIIKNEIGLSILKEVEKVIPYNSDRINKKIKIISDFLYENLHGNGMLVYNKNFINVYDNSVLDSLEILAAVNSIQNKKSIIFDKFKNLKEMDNHLEKFYNQSNIYQQIKLNELDENIIDDNKKREINKIKEELKNKSYMIGDDVFYISELNGQISKQYLLNERTRYMSKEGIETIIPCEFGETTKYDLSKVIEGNNNYAKYSKCFSANLHTMPLEKSAVDSGSLYEIALNLFMGGYGVINIDNKWKSIKGLESFLKQHKKRLIILENASNEEMAKSLKKLDNKLNKNINIKEELILN
jgi:hypothetical protein